MKKKNFSWRLPPTPRLIIPSMKGMLPNFLQVNRYIFLFYRLLFFVFVLLGTGFATTICSQMIITVNSTGDAGDATGGTGPCNDGTGNCTLRAAIETARANPPSSGMNLIQFNVPAPALIVIQNPLLPFSGVHLNGKTQPGYTGLPIVEISGNNAINGVDGLSIGSGCIVEGLVINRFSGNGIHVFATGGVASNTIIRDNFIGTDPTGTIGKGNRGNGIRLSASHAVRSIAIVNNLISGNEGSGVEIDRVTFDDQTEASFNVVRGNKIGTDLQGTIAIPNSMHGVVIRNGASNNEVGGSIAGQSNLISGNGEDGVLITDNGSNANRVQNNIIGANRNRSAALRNGLNGVEIRNHARSNSVTNNEIEGNMRHGVLVENFGTNFNTITSNFIGSASMPNGMDGVHILGGPHGTGMSGNNIGNNDGNGISIDASDASIIANNTVFGNLGSGVVLQNGATANVIGGAGNLQQNDIRGNFGGGLVINGAVGNFIRNNVISFNRLAGVAISAGSENAVLSNSIFSNIALPFPNQQNGLGIDLGGVANGVTPNDVGDADGGSNNQQNFPVLTSAVTSGNVTTIQGTLHSLPNTVFRIEFFGNSECDPLGFGEGENFLGFTQVTTNTSGNASFLEVFTLRAGTSFVTATATDPQNNTSEFSACRQVSGGTLPVAADLALTKVADKMSPTLGETVKFTLTLTNNGPAKATNIKLLDLLPLGLHFVQVIASTGIYNNITGVWDVPTLANGAMATLQLSARTAKTGTITNDAAITASDEPDPETANNAASVILNVQPATPPESVGADLSLAKSVDKPLSFIGEELTFTTTVFNNGPQTSTNVFVKDRLPGGMTLLAVTPSQGTYNTSTALWSVGTLANGSTATLMFKVQLTKAETITNVATIAGSRPQDTNFDNNQAFAAITVLPVPKVQAVASVERTSKGLMEQDRLNVNKLAVYPNPFSTGTMVGFFLSKATRLDLGVYDAQGRLVTMLMNKVLPEGYHTVHWQPHNVPAGTYVIQLRADGISHSHRLVYTRK